MVFNFFFIFFCCFFYQKLAAPMVGVGGAVRRQPSYFGNPVLAFHIIIDIHEKSDFTNSRLSLFLITKYYYLKIVSFNP